MPHDKTILNVSRINIVLYQAIADTGATGNFVLPENPVSNIEAATNPLVINMPDGKKIMSTHTCLLNAPGLPEKAKVARIVPGLAHAPLVFINKLYDAGCKFSYEEY